MRRRAVLGGIGGTLVPLTGCTGASSFGSPDNDQYTIEEYSLNRSYPTRSPVAFETTLTESDISQDSPGIAEFTVSNRENTTVYVFSAPDPPFGTIYAIPRRYIDNRDSQSAYRNAFPLWQDRYNTDSSGVQIVDSSTTINVNSASIGTKIEPNSEITQVFKFRFDMANLDSGSYFMPININYITTNDPPGQKSDLSGPEDSIRSTISFNII